MSFTKRQNNVAAWASGTTMSVTMPASTVPIQGNIVVVGMGSAFGRTITAVKDGNNNSLSITPHSPASVNDATAGSAWLAWYVVPSNPHATFTATFDSTPSFGSISVIEFTVTGAAPSLDMDIAGNGTGTTVNTPTVVAAAAGELLYAQAVSENAISNVNSPWTLNTISQPGMGGGDGYILSSSAGSTAVDMTESSGGFWDSMAASFTQATPQVFVAGDDSQQITVIQQADNVISIW